MMTMADDPEGAASPLLEKHLEDSLVTVREALTTLKYGSVSLIVHEGRVVQLDVTEKRRIKLD